MAKRFMTVTIDYMAWAIGAMLISSFVFSTLSYIVQDTSGVKRLASIVTVFAFLALLTSVIVNLRIRYIDRHPTSWGEPSRGRHLLPFGTSSMGHAISKTFSFGNSTYYCLALNKDWYEKDRQLEGSDHFKIEMREDHFWSKTERDPSIHYLVSGIRFHEAELRSLGVEHIMIHGGYNAQFSGDYIQARNAANMIFVILQCNSWTTRIANRRSQDLSLIKLWTDSLAKIVGVKENIVSVKALASPDSVIKDDEIVGVF
jgi:hypothetical protein